MFTIYAEKVSSDRDMPYDIAHGKMFDLIPPGIVHKGDVILWGDKDKTRFLAVVPGFYSNCPTRRNKYQMLNCMKYRLEWVVSQ